MDDSLHAAPFALARISQWVRAAAAGLALLVPKPATNTQALLATLLVKVVCAVDDLWPLKGGAEGQENVPGGATPPRPPGKAAFSCMGRAKCTATTSGADGRRGRGGHLHRYATLFGVLAISDHAQALDNSNDLRRRATCWAASGQSSPARLSSSS